MRLSDEQMQTCAACIDRVVRAYHKHKGLPGPIEHQCLLWSFMTLVTLRDLGIHNAQLQAGTAYWPISTPETDDGVSPTQYGYCFEMGSATKQNLLRAELPEMHAWVAIAEHPQEIIDLTAPFFKVRAIRDFGYKYTAPDPPPYLWCEPESVPRGACYWPDVRAIKIAIAFMKSMTSGSPLVLDLRD